MQYQILDRTGKIIAWIDSESQEQIIQEDYVLRISQSWEPMPYIEKDGNIYPVITHKIDNI